MTLRELNRATLARQLLLRRHRMPLVRAVERIGGMQGQWAPSPYLGLHARLEGFRRRSLEEAAVRMQVVKALLMRATLHIVSMADYLVFTSALNGGGASPVNAEAMAFGEQVAADVRALFADGPLGRSDVFEWLEREHGTRQDASMPWMSWYAIRVVAHVVHAPASAAWRSPISPRFVALEGVVLPDPVQARVELVRRYLGAFGPATRADIADWSGLRVRDFAPALGSLEPLRRFRDEQGRELLDLPRAPLPPGDTPAPVRFLPKWDSVLLAHADRRRVLPDAYRKVVIAKNGDVAQTFLVDGVVAGTWSVAKGIVRTEPFAAVPRSAQRELREEAGRLEAFLARNTEVGAVGSSPSSDEGTEG